MTRVVLPSGFVYHKPPYTQEEADDIYRRVAGMETFTRPGGSRRTTASSTAAQPEEPQNGEGPGDPAPPPASPTPTDP
jgi:hypothetical protein